jgi:hypothetical protein
MIDLSTETTLSLKQAAHISPTGRKGRPTHLSTVWRWILTGAKAPDGTLVRLEAVRLGGRWVTSREALQRFAERLTPRLDTPAPPQPRTVRARERASRRAEKELEKIGI